MRSASPASIHSLIPKCPLLENFSRRRGAPAGAFHGGVPRAARRGDDPRRRGRRPDADGDRGPRRRAQARPLEHPAALAQVEPGRTLGEMSMIDGEPRFATCVAVEPTLVAVLDRENLARIIVEQPLLGAKLLMELVLCFPSACAPPAALLGLSTSSRSARPASSRAREPWPACRRAAGRGRGGRVLRRRRASLSHPREPEGAAGGAAGLARGPPGGSGGRVLRRSTSR